jgi:phosphoribosylamine---glycine ligase
LKPLIIGSGAREHTIAWKFSKSKRISGLFIAPGNAGTDDLGENIPELDITDEESVIRTIAEKQINFVFIGPEAPLAAGLADCIRKENVPVFGPGKKAAQLESSKTFAKQFMVRNGVPTAEAREFSDYPTFSAYLEKNGGGNTVVIKKSGLAGGKGVLESTDRNVLAQFGREILKNDSLLVEEYLEGYEISVFAITDGKQHIVLPPCADFKKSGEGDSGKNTGGMGSICPVPGVTKAMMEDIEKMIVGQTFAGMKQEGLSYKGVLYFGLMITENGPKVLEYNVRFGDPETQVLLPLIDSDFGNLMDAVAHEKLDRFPLRLSDNSALGVVIAADGYPESYKKAVPVSFLPPFKDTKLLVFHASTQRDKNGTIVTEGGRCFTVVGLHEDLLDAQITAYEGAREVKFGGAWYRKDIGNKFFFPA